MTQYTDLAEYTIDRQLDKTRDLATRARRAAQRPILLQLRSLGATLVATRNNLNAAPDYYLETARAVVTVADQILTEAAAELDRAELGITRHAARVNADDVIAWCEYVGIELLPWQRSYIEGRLTA